MSLGLKSFQPAVLLLAGIGDDASAPIIEGTGGWQVASCSANVSKCNISLAAPNSITVLMLLL